MAYQRKMLIPRHLTPSQVRAVYSSARWPESFFRSIKNKYEKIHRGVFVELATGKPRTIVLSRPGEPKKYYNIGDRKYLSYYEVRKYYREPGPWMVLEQWPGKKAYQERTK